MSRIAGDDRFAAVRDSLHAMLQPSQFVGRAPEQVRGFVVLGSTMLSKGG
jgi:hypothetical protein